jgi:hypothetical protein
LVEHLTENQGVGGSIPSLAINQCNKKRAATWLPVSALCAYKCANAGEMQIKDYREGIT